MKTLIAIHCDDQKCKVIAEIYQNENGKISYQNTSTELVFESMEELKRELEISNNNIMWVISPAKTRVVGKVELKNIQGDTVIYEIGTHNNMFTLKLIGSDFSTVADNLEDLFQKLVDNLFDNELDLLDL